MKARFKKTRPLCKAGQRWRFRLRDDYGNRGTYVRTVAKVVWWGEAGSWMILFTKPLPEPWRQDMWEGHVAKGELLT